MTAAQPLTDAQIVEIRDDHLPSQGEPFDCLAFARAILAATSHEHAYCPHCRPCKHSERVDAYDDVLRGLASYLSAGGFNSPGLIDPQEADAKIRWGIDNFVKVEVERLLRATQNTQAEKASGSAPPVPGPEPDRPGPSFESPAQSTSSSYTIPGPYAPILPSAAPAQEPVAWYHNDNGSLELSRIRRVGWKPLYAAPPPDEARELLRASLPILDSAGKNNCEVAFVASIRAYLARHK